MKNLPFSFTLFVLATICLIGSGCASSYHRINPDLISFQNQINENGAVLSYRYGVLSDAGNKKYAKKEQIYGYDIVAIKFTNQTNRSLLIGRDVKLFTGGLEVVPVEPGAVASVLKQNSAIYLLYLLLTFARLETNDSSIPIGIALGPGIALGNMGVAASANTNLKNELLQYEIIGQTVSPGETVIGLVGLHNMGYNPLSMKIVN